jgi:hypothetical protein
VDVISTAPLRVLQLLDHPNSLPQATVNYEFTPFTPISLPLLRVPVPVHVSVLNAASFIQGAIAPGEIFTLRARWAPHMDPWTRILGGTPGHEHHEALRSPQQQTILEAMEKARVGKGGHNSGHNANLTERGGQAESVAIN